MLLNAVAVITPPAVWCRKAKHLNTKSSTDLDSSTLPTYTTSNNSFAHKTINTIQLQR